MSEIAKCPHCGGPPKFWMAPDKAGCCGYFVTSEDRRETIRLWNKYAAAMKLADAAVWADECAEQKDYIDDTSSNFDAWRSIFNTTLDAEKAASEAYDRVLEVFK